MCGIAGFIDLGARTPREELEAVAGRMADALAHRGPDDRGTWADPAAGVGLGHRRLAIVDLSPEGHQPMLSADGRWVVVYNGEIYNHAALSRELVAAGDRFRGHSDTEVLLAAVSRYGVEGALRRFVGIFAIALWDRRERALHLVRDHVGVKPLYWGVSDGVVTFGSELKALRAHPAFGNLVDRGALASFLRHGYIEAPRTIYLGVRKVPPGCVVTLRAGADPDNAVPVPYWSARAAAERGATAPLADPRAAAERLEVLLREAVGLQMVADVPVGAFLSGGVDSSLVVALMQAASTRPVRTFTIGFAEAAYDESAAARAVAAHLNTDHTELILTPDEARTVIPELPRMYDEPFADVSSIPTALVSRLARRQVTVSLSGDGGDELFGGYRKYHEAERLWRARRFLPGPLGVLAGRAVAAVPPALWGSGGGATGSRAERARKAARALQGRTPQDLYRRVMSGWTEPPVLAAEEPPTAFTDPARWARVGDFPRWMMATDLVSWLPDDILVKVDRASMAVALEARVPLLDHRVVEFAWSLPPAWKLKDGVGKLPLRALLDRYVPRALVERPKMGFGVPVGAWLRGPLQGWAADLLAEDRLQREGWLDPAPVRRAWEAHASAQADRTAELWPVLMFQAWLDARR